MTFVHVAGGLFGLLVSFSCAVAARFFIKDWQRTALQRRINPDYQWHFYEPGLDLMRRRAIDGSWQYRAMTDAECHKYIADRW